MDHSVVSTFYSETPHPQRQQCQNLDSDLPFPPKRADVILEHSPINFNLISQDISPPHFTNYSHLNSFPDNPA